MADYVGYLQKIDRSSLTGDDDSRTQVLAAAKALVYRLEEPWERVYDFVICHPTQMQCVRTAQKLQLFSHLSSTPRSGEDLAKATGCDIVLLQRLLRVLVVWRWVDEADINAYRATDASVMLSKPNGIQGALDILFNDQRAESMRRFPDYLESINYTNPTSIQNAPWKWCIGKPDYPGDAWDWFIEIGLSAANNNFLTGLRLDLPPWPELYDIQQFIHGWDGQSALVVDIGGSKGKDVSDVARAIETLHPSAQLVLQDRPETVSQGKADGTLHRMVTPMAHDFFNVQPIKEARVYFLRQVIHDWPDQEASQILSAIRPAMKKGYSKVLLMEWVLPDKVKDTTEREAAMDVHMAQLHGAMERNEGQWKSLFEKAGLRYVGFTPIHGHTSIIEAEL